MSIPEQKMVNVPAQNWTPGLILTRTLVRVLHRGQRAGAGIQARFSELP